MPLSETPRSQPRQREEEKRRVQEEGEEGDDELGGGGRRVEEEDRIAPRARLRRVHGSRPGPLR